MTEAQEPHTPPPDKTRRAVILATVGIVVILGLAMFYVAVVAPLRETHKVVQSSNPRYASASLTRDQAIERFDGPERGARRLVTYLRLPRWMEADRCGAVYLLGRCGVRAVPALVRILRDTDDEVRAWAAEALGEIGPEAKVAIPALMKALGDSKGGVRLCAARALGRVGPEAKAAVPALIKALGDSDYIMRECAAGALGAIGPEAKVAVPALVKLSEDASFVVRQAAAAALKKIRGGE